MLQHQLAFAMSNLDITLFSDLWLTHTFPRLAGAIVSVWACLFWVNVKFLRVQDLEHEKGSQWQLTTVQGFNSYAQAFQCIRP